MSTVVDVANLAGVSVATVSRVIQSSNRVSDEKRERVLRAIRELNYETNANANGGRARKKTILLICGSCQDEFIDSINEAASESNYEIAIHYTVGHSLKLNSYLRKLLKHGVVSGVVTFALTAASAQAVEKINEHVPVVQCCDALSIPNSFVVSSNDFEMARDAVRHLAEKGYRRVGFVGLGKMTPPFLYSSYREHGYISALEECGMPVDERLMAQCDLTGESVETALDRFLQAESRPDAIFCVRDLTAVALVNALTRRGVKVPEEMAVFGCGSAESAEQCWLPLSNVMHSYYEIGVEAINIMHSRIAGKATLGRTTYIHHKIVDRSTT